MGLHRICLAILMALAIQPAGAADDYPFSGPRTLLPLDDVVSKRRAFACLGSFTLQHSDGSYRAYHLDPKPLRDDNRLCYVAWEAGACTFDASKNIETCRVEKSVYGISTEYGRFFGDDPDDVPVAYGSSLDALMQGQPTSQSVSCPFTQDTIARYLSEEWTTYPQTVVDALTFDDPTPRQALFRLAGLILAEDDGTSICAPD